MYMIYDVYKYIYIYRINLYAHVNICIYRFVCIYVWIGKKFLPPPQPKSDDLLEISYPERSHFEERMGKFSEEVLIRNLPSQFAKVAKEKLEINVNFVIE